MLVKTREDKGSIKQGYLTEIVLVAIILATVYAVISLPRAVRKENERAAESFVEQAE